MKGSFSIRYKGYCTKCNKIKKITEDNWCERCLNNLRIDAENALDEYINEWESGENGEVCVEAEELRYDLEECKTAKDYLDFIKCLEN